MIIGEILFLIKHIRIFSNGINYFYFTLEGVIIIIKIYILYLRSMTTIQFDKNRSSI